MRAREPASFWRENVIAVVILLRFCENDLVRERSYQLLEVLSFRYREKA